MIDISSSSGNCSTWFIDWFRMYDQTVADCSAVNGSDLTSVVHFNKHCSKTTKFSELFDVSLYCSLLYDSRRSFDKSVSYRTAHLNFVSELAGLCLPVHRKLITDVLIKSPLYRIDPIFSVGVAARKKRPFIYSRVASKSDVTRKYSVDSFFMKWARKTVPLDTLSVVRYVPSYLRDTSFIRNIAARPYILELALVESCYTLKVLTDLLPRVKVENRAKMIIMGYWRMLISLVDLLDLMDVLGIIEASESTWIEIIRNFQQGYMDYITEVYGDINRICLQTELCEISLEDFIRWSNMDDLSCELA